MIEYIANIVRMNKRHILFAILFVFGATLVALFWGVPVPRSGHLKGVHSVVTGIYSPKDRVLVPTKEITNLTEVSFLLNRLANSPQRLVQPTLGTLRGPAVLLDGESEPLVAVFYQREHRALVFYDVRKKDKAFEIMNEQSLLHGIFQRVFSYNLFEDASGKWQALMPTATNIQTIPK